VFILVTLTLLGHACELPLGMLVAHAHEDAHESSDHHADETQMACDAVPAIRPSPHTLSTLDVDVYAELHPVLDAVAPPVVAVLPDVSARYRRSPLFLLHAALLI
jgi:hypothetical protein